MHLIGFAGGVLVGALIVLMVVVSKFTHILNDAIESSNEQTASLLHVLKAVRHMMQTRKGGVELGECPGCGKRMLAARTPFLHEGHQN